MRENRPALFVQDDWKATRDLTFNLGVRWDPWLPPTDRNTSLVGFAPGVQSTVTPNAPVGLQFIGDRGLQDSIYRKNWKDFGPRFGFAYNVGGSNKLVVRGGYGLFYGFPEGLLYQRTDQTQPRDLSVSIPNPANTWDKIFGGTTDPFPAPHMPLSAFSKYRLAGGFVNGWQLNTIVNAATGPPITVLSGTDRSLSGVGNDYADYVPGQSLSRPAGSSFVKQYFNTTAFAPAATGTFGNTARGILRGPGSLVVDASAFKSISVTERIKLQFRAEAFNVINRANYSNPGSTVASASTFGVITAAGSPRVLQFALRALF